MRYKRSVPRHAIKLISQVDNKTMSLQNADFSQKKKTSLYVGEYQKSYTQLTTQDMEHAQEWCTLA